MPSLAQLAVSSTDPTLTQVVATTPIIEPLDGPTSVDDVMDRFSEEVYQQGRDTHLYRFLTALCGDSGIGLLKTQAFSSRLQFEAEFFHNSLDAIYAAQFQIHRLASEVISWADARTDAVTPVTQADIDLANQSYYHRAQEFFTAIRYGNSPLGMATMARAGSGFDSDVVENYRYVFDNYSDMKLGLLPAGTTISTAEFIVFNRCELDLDAQFTLPWTLKFIFHDAIISGSTRPIAAPTGGNKLSVARSYDANPVQALIPSIERNVIDVLDRLRPVDTIVSVNPASDRYTRIPLNGPPASSSDRLSVSRFVTGRPDVVWPVPDPTKGFFIEANLENEATTYRGTGFELPVIFQTIENILAYTERALTSPQYGANDFYTFTDGIAPVSSFTSEHDGSYFNTLLSIFPYLGSVTPDIHFGALNATASQDTQLIYQGKAVA